METIKIIEYILALIIWAVCARDAWKEKNDVIREIKYVKVWVVIAVIFLIG